MFNPTKPRRSIGIAAALVAGTAMITATIAEARPNRVRASGQNGVVAAGGGANGGYVRGRGAARNAEGGVTSASGGAFATAGGARGARASTATVNPDGSRTRRGGYGVSGARGSASGESNIAVGSDGIRTGTISSTATSAATGNSYAGSTAINSATGKPVRTATCTDASGNAIACPR